MDRNPWYVPKTLKNKREGQQPGADDHFRRDAMGPLYLFQVQIIYAIILGDSVLPSMVRVQSGQQPSFIFNSRHSLRRCADSLKHPTVELMGAIVAYIYLKNQH